MITPDEIARTDPGFARIVSRFEAEVHEHGGLDERSRALCVLAALIALDETDEFVLRLGEALNGVLTPFWQPPTAFLPRAALRCRYPRRTRVETKTAAKPARACRSPSSARIWPISGSPARRRRAASTAG